MNVTKHPRSRSRILGPALLALASLGVGIGLASGGALPQVLRLPVALGGYAGFALASRLALQRWRPDLDDLWRIPARPDRACGPGEAVPAPLPFARRAREENRGSRYGRPLARLAGVLAVVACGTARAQAPAAPAPTPTPAPRWSDDVTVNAFVSASYSYGFNKPPSGTNTLRVFDFDDNTIKVDVAEVVVQKAVSAPGDAGFRVDLAAGGSIPRISSSPGLLQGQDVDVQQAFVSYILPVGRGLRLDAGKWVTHLGWELIDGYDGYNDNASRSLLFGYAIPFTHTGLKATYAFSDTVTGMLEIVNGCEVVKDNNSGKSIGLQLAINPSKAVSIWLNAMTGPERAGVNSDPRTHLNLVAQWRATDRVALTLDAAYGTEKGAVAPGETATWTALAGYARLGVSDTFALILRGEVFDDPDGARTGAAQKLEEITLTPELKLTPKLVFRADLRVDFSDERVFSSDTGAKKQQATLLLNALYTF